MVITDELRLKAFDALLWKYYWLYVKRFALGGINQEEFENLKCFFIEACRMAKSLLTEFVRKYDGIDTDDFDVVIERAEHWRILHDADCWKRMYHILLPHAEENSMTEIERDRVFSAYDLLKISKYTLAAWLIIEKEKGVTGKDNPDLLRKLSKYLSCQHYRPFWYEYLEIPFVTRAEIWEAAEKKDYGDIHPDVWDSHVDRIFDNEMEKLLAKQGIVYPQTMPAELKDKFTGSYSFVFPLSDEREICILSAMKDNHALEMIYYCFENGKSHLSSECITPVKMMHTGRWWTLVGVDKEGKTKKYVVNQIVEIKINKQEYGKEGKQ